MTPMFSLGHIRITAAVLEMLERFNISPDSLIQRHVLGDWGDVSDADKKSNDLAVEMGGRILSVYTLPDGTAKIWVYTEGDRRETTILLPDDD